MPEDRQSPPASLSPPAGETHRLQHLERLVGGDMALVQDQCRGRSRSVWSLADKQINSVNMVR